MGFVFLGSILTKSASWFDATGLVVTRKMRILALDSATSACSAAVLCDGEITAHRYEEMSRGQAESLIPMIADTMSAAELEFDLLDAIAVTVGPGAYTGVRIGLSTAQSLALASGKPLVGVTTFEAVFAAQGETFTPCLVALDTKREDLYIQLFDATGEALTEALAVEEKQISMAVSVHGIKVVGDAAERAARALNDAGIAAKMHYGPMLPDASWIARIAAGRFSEGALVPVEPIYLRAPDVGPPPKPIA
jgi:tRNA threonylcarbamoyladenosine biosynthesis protein TsaB